MDSQLTRMGTAYRIVRTRFGKAVLPLFAGMVYANIRFAVAIGMALDTVLFPKLRKKVVRKPIILVGNPRTGTTFLQRFLSDNGYGAGMEVYRMLYPSLTLQLFIKPILPLLEIISPAKYHSTPAHKTSLSSVETDDVGVLFRYFDGYFFYGFFLAFDDEDHMAQMDPEVRDTSDRDLAWLDELWRRSLVAHDSDTVIAKLFSLGPRIPQLLAKYPDANILYMARDPLNVIPSGMSLVSGVLDNAFGFWSAPEELRQRWLDRMYNGLVELLQRFHDHWTSGKIDKSRVYVVRYDRMMQDFEGVMDGMHSFLGIEPTEAQAAAIADRGEKQRAYKSGHKYDLAKFGLTEEKIRKDCAFFYETFLPPLEEVAEKTA